MNPITESPTQTPARTRAERVPPSDGVGALRKTVVSVKGVRLACWVGGRGPHLLMLHGFTLSHRQWDGLAAELMHSHTVVVADHPGHGDSEGLPGPFSLRRNAELFAGLMDELGATRFSGIGHSAGAMTLLHLAARQPQRLASMVMIAGAHRLSRRGRELAQVDRPELGPVEYQTLLGEIHPGGAGQIERIFEQFRGFHANHDDFAFSPERLQEITTRTLLVWGDRDDYFPIEFGLELLRSMPNAELMVCPGQGHVPLWPTLGGDDVVASVFPRIAQRFLSGPAAPAGR